MSLRSLVAATILIALAVAAPAGAVVGGHPATEDYPWMAAVETGGGLYCGGSLVRPDWVLTAAHCTDQMKPEDFTVVIGRHTLSAAGGETHPVDQIVQDPGYPGDDGGNDVSLLHLAQPSSAPTVRLVSLQETALWAAGKPARVIGWGSSVFLVGPSSDELQEVDLPMVADDDCSTSYNDFSPFIFNPETMVCAGETTGLKDSCQGDSGGPLLVKDAAGQWVQVGNTSFGLGCGFPLYYGVYGRLGAPAMHDWVQSQLPAQGPAAAPAPAAAPSAPADPAPAAPAAATPKRVRLKWDRALRRSKRGVVLLVTASGKLTGLRATLKRGSKVIARGAKPQVAGRAAVLLPLRKTLKPGRLRIELRGTDAAGRAVTRSGLVRAPR